MVWSTYGSSLQKAVEQFNNGDGAVKPRHSEPQDIQHEPPMRCSQTAVQNVSPLQDKDFLLIAGLILLLLHEKADNKLIFALLFVLFG